MEIDVDKHILVTDEQLNSTKVKTYSSGRLINIGDQILWGLLRNSDNTMSYGIIFCQDEIGKTYEFLEYSGIIPELRKIV
jgi:hypothetical protein